MSAPADPSDKLLYLENVYKSYGPTLILDDIDLSVRPGEFCSVVGPSGCGKSTLLRLILGAEPPTAGRVLLEGEAIGHPDPRRGIVYQRYSLFPHLTVLENVLLGKRLSAGFWSWRRERPACVEEACALLRTMRLEGDRDKYPYELSGGMQQRVAIAQALIMRPKILLMDEPFGALDPGVREDMQVHLLETWERLRMTVFFVTHDLSEAVFLGTRVLVLSQFYTDERGDGFARGARVVGDYALADEANSTAIKRTGRFADLVETIRREGFEPEVRQHVDTFNLVHPDSWRSLDPREAGGSAPKSLS
ncbi:MAG: ABC transporter ATP-binding protein [Elusimicrobia bacterium]|nr:ABC transporter ATP-binding protein [Elusimicrobiota bacterium]